MATQRQPKPQWVYKKIVKNDKDFVGLIAYGLYKRRKSELAGTYRKSGISEDEITKKLKDFHDQEVQGNSALEAYRHSAERLLSDMLTKNHEAAKQEAFECMLDAAENSQISSTPWYRKMYKWLFSGVPSAVATIFLTALIFGALAFVSAPTEKGKLASSVVNKALGEEVVQPTPAK